MFSGIVTDVISSGGRTCYERDLHCKCEEFLNEVAVGKGRPDYSLTMGCVCIRYTMKNKSSSEGL